MFERGLLHEVPAINTSPWVRVIVIADDLTGACDAAVAFSCRGVDTEVLMDWRRVPEISATVVAIDTESREIPVREAVNRLTSTAKQLDLNGYSHIFKKIDSVFRGNTFDEIEASLREFPFSLAILAPAYPALGRTSTEGIVRVRDIAGQRTFAILDRLQAAGLQPSHIAAGSTPEEVAEALKISLREGHRLVYCDADSEADLDAVVRGTRKLGVSVLWIGSAGLASALALDLSCDIGENRSSPSLQVTQPVPTSGAVVFFTGSDHPVTQRQMFALRKQIDLTEYPLDAPLPLSKSTGAFVVTVRRGSTTESICRAMQGFRQQGVSCLFMTGGDTATLVCRALGIQSLQLRDEFEPGLPCGVAVGGPFAGSTVILKSGGFGETDVLCHIARTFQTRNEGYSLNQRLPNIVVTLGDPAGVGCEVTLKALNDPAIRALAHWILIGDQATIDAAEHTTGVKLAGLSVEFRDSKILVPDEPISFGELRAEYGKAAAAYVYTATRMCLDGEADAMVTAPLNKEAVTMSGLKFSGHTEYIAEICGVNDSRMLLAGVKLSVVHVSTHTSLKKACELNTDRIIRTIVLGNEAMKLLGHAAPRIAVCGLNPHAGEHGLFGNEDEEFIKPAVDACRRQGIDCEGPVASDTIFFRAVKGSHDLIVAMYHDQGHIPMKLLDFEATVNTSLGIPIIRTSVDHGTAFDIAGKNIASDGNMRAAMKMAATMAHHRIHQASVAT